MKTKDIYNLLKGKINPTDFLKKYNDEIAKYETLITQIGSSVPIYVEEDYAFEFCKEHLINICDYYINNSLKEIEINYLVDCITLSDKIELDDSMLDILVTFTDQEINGKLSKEYILNIITQLNDIQ